MIWIYGTFIFSITHSCAAFHWTDLAHFRFGIGFQASSPLAPAPVAGPARLPPAKGQWVLVGICCGRRRPFSHHASRGTSISSLHHPSAMPPVHSPWATAHPYSLAGLPPAHSLSRPPGPGDGRSKARPPVILAGLHLCHHHHHLRSMPGRSILTGPPPVRHLTRPPTRRQMLRRKLHLSSGPPPRVLADAPLRQLRISGPSPSRCSTTHPQ